MMLLSHKDFDRNTYKGYYFLKGHNGYWYISKEGHHVTTCCALKEAKRRVDELTKGESK
jgi:hypothetical protein